MNQLLRIRSAAPRALAGLALALAACASFKAGPPQVISGEVSAASERILWQIVALTLSHESFPVGTGFDPVDNTAVSGWRMSLAPFKGKGWREQAYIHYETIGPGQYRLDIRVTRQLNQDMAKPLDAGYADWEDAPDDVERAQVLLQGIRSWLAEDQPLAVPQSQKP